MILLQLWKGSPLMYRSPYFLKHLGVLGWRLREGFPVLPSTLQAELLCNTNTSVQPKISSYQTDSRTTVLQGCSAVRRGSPLSSPSWKKNSKKVYQLWREKLIFLERKETSSGGLYIPLLYTVDTPVIATTTILLNGFNHTGDRKVKSSSHIIGEMSTFSWCRVNVGMCIFPVCGFFFS